MSEPNDKNDDLAMFHEAIRDVKPLRKSERSDSSAPKPGPYPKRFKMDDEEIVTELLDDPDDSLDLESGEELLFLRNGVQKRYLTRLKRGRYSIEDHLDLHQMNEMTAANALLAFIDSANKKGIGCVRVVHGKGLRSRKGPVLKQMTRRLLRRHPLVMAFASCRPADGGTGAVNVLLKAKR
ncbi:MAG: DNA-nicking Smr family endonuclease [Gammaproteobacteria bacterium]